MKLIPFLLFISVFLSLYGLLNYYVYVWGLRLLPAYPQVRLWYRVVFIQVALSFIAGRLLERFGLYGTAEVLEWIGSFWFGAMTYFFLIFLLYDFIRLLHHFLPVLHPEFIRRAAGIASFVAVTLALTYGYFNALNIRVREFEFFIPKKAGGLQELNIVMASDIHLGVIVGKKRFNRLVEKINALKPDIVLLPGDILDEDIAPVIRENLGEALKAIRAPLGLFACTGNHEYIGGIEKADHYLREHGITLLRDQVQLVKGSFYLAGREDRSGVRFTGWQRKNLPELLRGVDKTYPVILLDHQPYQLETAAENHVDLQLSGHTHHGQLWPVNWITDLIYERSYGYLKKGGTHIYISSGAGTWGPPIRIYANPEIARIRLRFNEEKELNVRGMPLPERIH